MGRKPAPPPPATRAEIARLTRHLKGLRRRGLSPATLASYESYWGAVGRWYADTEGRPFDAVALDTPRLRRYREAVTASQTQSTAKAWLRWLASYLAATVGLDETQAAALNLPLPRAKHPPHELLAGARHLLDRIKARPSRLLLELCLYGGLTVPEALALRWRSVQLDRAVLWVGRRQVPIHPSLRRRLRAVAGSAREPVVGLASQKQAARALKLADSGGPALLPREFRAAFVAAYRAANRGEPLITRALHCLTGSTRLLEGARPKALPTEYLAKTVGRLKYPRQ